MVGGPEIRMRTERRFADFYDGALPFQMDRIPEGGMCLSVFLVLWRGNSQNVLLGKVNPEYDWIRIGALSKEAARRIINRWMLPWSHLLLYESPQNAARRVLKEQLDVEWAEVKSLEFEVFSEDYSEPKHWDIEFVFKGELDRLPQNPAWNEPKFVDFSKTPDQEFARRYQDILAELGLRH